MYVYNHIHIVYNRLEIKQIKHPHISNIYFKSNPPMKKIKHTEILKFMKMHFFPKKHLPFLRGLEKCVQNTEKHDLSNRKGPPKMLMMTLSNIHQDRCQISNTHCLWVLGELGEPKHIPELFTPGTCCCPSVMRCRPW